MGPLDLRGLPCPEPVVRTKKAIEANPNAVLVVLTDQASQRDNIARMARSLGASVQSEALPNGDFQLTLTTGAPQRAAEPAPVTEPCAAPVRAVVFIKNNVVAHGDPALGRILMKAFLKTLKSLDPLPSAILFLNNGVHLTTEGSEEIPILTELASLGIEIVSCGTCLDFYKKLDQVRVGIVGNMFDIVDRLHRAPRVIAP